MVLLNGETVKYGTTEQILHDPQCAYTKRLMVAVRPVPKASASRLDIAKLYEENIIEIKHVNAGYDTRLNGRVEVNVLEDVCVAVPRGSVMGVIGKSGSRKSKLARMILGLLPPSSGSVWMNQKPLPGNDIARSREQLRRVQIVMQMPDVCFNKQKTVGAALERPLEFYLDMSAAQRKVRMAELLNMVELLTEFSGCMPQALSGGQKQRVKLARALAANPDVIICDEVTSALDTVVGSQIIDLLKRLQGEMKVTFIFVSHDLSTIASFADQIVVMHQGRVVDQGTTDAVLTPPFHPYTNLFLRSVPEMRQGWLEEILDIMPH